MSLRLHHISHLYDNSVEDGPTSIDVLPLHLRIPSSQYVSAYISTPTQRHGPPLPFPRDTQLHAASDRLTYPKVPSQGRHLEFILRRLPGSEAGFERVSRGGLGI